MRALLTTLEEQDIEEPGELPDDASKAQEMLHKEKIHKWITATETYLNAKVALYDILWGQCSKLMKQKVEAQLKTEPAWISS